MKTDFGELRYPAPGFTEVDVHEKDSDQVITLGFNDAMFNAASEYRGGPAHIRSVSDACVFLVEQAEGLRLKAYLDPVGIPTLGIGTTRYPNGKRVKMGDTCTKEEAYAWCKADLAAAAKAVDDLTIDALTQGKFDALSSFVYNVGRENYRKSALRKLVNANPDDPAIRKEFLRWNKGRGEVLPGLTTRRRNEANLFFS